MEHIIVEGIQKKRNNLTDMYSCTESFLEQIPRQSNTVKYEHV